MFKKVLQLFCLFADMRFKSFGMIYIAQRDFELESPCCHPPLCEQYCSDLAVTDFSIIIGARKK